MNKEKFYQNRVKTPTILQIDKGRCVASGTYEDLMAAKGLFYEMAAYQ